MTISTKIALLVADAGLDGGAAEAYYEEQPGYWDDNPEGFVAAFEEAYAGQWGSEAEWAEEFLEDTGQLEAIPDNLRHYFDYESWARDCRSSGDVTFIDSGWGDVYVFWNY